MNTLTELRAKLDRALTNVSEHLDEFTTTSDTQSELMEAFEDLATLGNHRAFRLTLSDHRQHILPAGRSAITMSAIEIHDLHRRLKRGEQAELTAVTS